MLSYNTPSWLLEIWSSSTGTPLIFLVPPMPPSLLPCPNLSIKQRWHPATVTYLFDASSLSTGTLFTFAISVLWCTLSWSASLPPVHASSFGDSQSQQQSTSLGSALCPPLQVQGGILWANTWPLLERQMPTWKGHSGKGAWHTWQQSSLSNCQN